MAVTREEAVSILERLRESVRHDPCWTCDCLQGLLVQLEFDAEEDLTDLTAELRVSREQMHPCLGCDPCPPGTTYADYLRRGDTA